MNKIYYIERIDNYFDYIMINSFVIIAKNVNECLNLAYNYSEKNRFNNNIWKNKKKIRIKKIGISNLKTQIIQTSEIDG